MLEQLSETDRAGHPGPAMEPLPGWFARRRRTCRPAARGPRRGCPAGPVLPSRDGPTGRRSPPAAGMSVGTAERRGPSTRCWRRSATATPSATRCVGHPARAARGRVRVGHLRRDRRLAPRAPDARLPRVDRGELTRTTSSSTTSRSGRARPAWRTRCPIGWCSSTTTSRRPSTSSACTRCWCSCASWAAANCAPTSTACVARARRLGVQPAGTRGAPASRDTAVLPVVPSFTHLDVDAEPLR